jgi:FkbM family methyltransferase
MRKLRKVEWLVRRTLSPSALHTYSLPGGVQFRYPLDSAIGQSLFVGGFENPELAFVLGNLKPGFTFVDLGANAGLFSVIAAKQVGATGLVYSIEPGQREQRLLRQNVELNRLTNVICIDQAVSDSEGEAEFAVSQDGAMNSLAKNSHPGQKIIEWKKVQLTTLDRLVEQHRIANIDFIKMDVEGAEVNVLAGAGETIRRFRPLIMCEFCDLTARGFALNGGDLWSAFEKLGYTMHSIDASKPGMLSRATRRSNYSTYENLVARYDGK